MRLNVNCRFDPEFPAGGGRHGGRVIFNGPLADFMAEETRTSTQKVLKGITL